MSGAKPGTHESLEAFFAQKSVAIRCPRGEIVVHAEDEPFGFFYIESGFVKVFSLNALGMQYVHVLYGPGDYFPMVWVVPGVYRSIYFETMTAATLRRVRPYELYEAMKQDVELCLDVLRMSLTQFTTIMDRVHNLEYRFARERLVYCLLSLARRFGVQKDDGHEIALKVSHQILASNINLSRESVGRELDRLIRKGMIVVKSGRIVIKDADALIKELPGNVRTDWVESMSSQVVTGLLTPKPNET
jgi:CRP/FNR family transcriptional regulator, cyclic AMP receptor protein